MARTAASATYSTTAIVLRVRPLGEKDRVVTLLAPERGKFDAAARGARGAKSKLAAAAQPFMLVRLLLAHGRSLDIITQAEIEDSHRHITEDIWKAAWGAYACEMCAMVPELLPDDTLFELLRAALGAWNESPPGSPVIEMIGRWFETRFLALSGYGPTLGRCVACGEKIVIPPEDIKRRVAFSATLGGTLCARCSSRDSQKFMANVQALRALRRLERAPGPPGPEMAQEAMLAPAAQRDLRDCLRRSLLIHFEFKPRSRAFLEEITAMQNLENNA